MSISTKNNKIIFLISEQIKTSDNKYLLNGIDLSKARFYYKEDLENFYELATSDYEVFEESGNTFLKINNTEINSIVELFQIAYELNFTGGQYDPTFDVDIEVLKDNYNKLVEDTKNIWEILKNQVFIADSLDENKILPALKEGEIWVKTSDGWKGITVIDFQKQISDALLALNSYTTLKENQLDNFEKDMELELNNHVETVNKVELNSYVENDSKPKIDDYINGFGETDEVYNYNTVAEMVASTYLVEGDRIQLWGYHNLFDNSNHKRIISSIDEGFGVQLANSKWANVVNDGEINVSWYGATTGAGNDNTDIFNYLFNNNDITVINFPKRNTYICLDEIIFNDTTTKKIINVNNSIIKFTNDTNGITFNFLNANYSRLTFNNMTLEGQNTNAWGNIFTSTKSGLSCTQLFYTVFNQCTFRQFKYGVSMILSCIKNSFINCFFDHNGDAGLNIDGSVVNVNKFDNCAFRLNRIKGIYMDGTAPFPTQNSFVDCLVESNNKYEEVQAGTNTGTGIHIKNVYRNEFRNIYIEAHEDSILLEGSGDFNKFSTIGFYSNSHGDGNLKLNGNSCYTEFESLNFSSPGPKIVDIGSTNSRYTFENAIGANVEDYINNSNYCFNACIDYAGVGFAPRLSETGWGLKNPVGSSIIVGGVLNTGAKNVIELGSVLGEDFSITSLAGYKINSFVTIFNYQHTHSVTFLASNNSGEMILKDREDIILNNYGDFAMFWINNLGRATEVSRRTQEETFVRKDSVPSWMISNKVYVEEGKGLIVKKTDGTIWRMPY